MSKVDHEARLTQLAKTRDDARAALDKAEKELRKGVVAADKAKAMSRRKIAQIAQISPQSVYNWLGLGKARS